MIRTLLAFALVPLVPAAAIIRDAGPLIALVYAYFLTYLFGVPAFLVLRKKKKESHVGYALCGAAAAASVGIILFVLGGGFEPALLLFALVLAGVGAVEGLCFSLIRGHEKNTA
jgi:hypothetical protein